MFLCNKEYLFLIMIFLDTGFTIKNLKGKNNNYSFKIFVIYLTIYQFKIVHIKLINTKQVCKSFWIVVSEKLKLY